ncbi:hypothetical protein [Longispora urticae]
MLKRVLALAAVTAALVIPGATPATAAPAPATQSGRSAAISWPEPWSAYSYHPTDGHCFWAGENYRAQSWSNQYYCAYEPDPYRYGTDWVLYINDLYAQG